MSREKRAEAGDSFAKPAVSQHASKAKKPVSTRVVRSAEAEGETEASGRQLQSRVPCQAGAVPAAGMAAAGAAGTSTGPSTDAETPWSAKTEKNKCRRSQEELPTTPPSSSSPLFSSSSLSSSSPPGDISSSFSSSSCSVSSSSACSSCASTFAASSFFAEERKKGVLYIARLPPQMNRVTLRQYFERFGALGRLHVSPLLEEGRSSASASRRRQQQQQSRGSRQPPASTGKFSCEEGGEERKKKKKVECTAVSYRVKAFDLEYAGGAEAWLEFLSRRDAKKVARLLDGQPVSSWAAGMGHGRGSARKARRQWNGDIWCLKYLKGFTWQQLIEEKLYTRRVREARLNAALSQIKRENAVYVQLVEQQKQIDKMREKKQAKQLAQQQQQTQEPLTNQAAKHNSAALGHAAAAAGGSGDAIKLMGLVGGNLWGTENSMANLQLPLAKNSNSSSSDSCKRCDGTAPAAQGSSSAQGGVRTPKPKLNAAGDAQQQKKHAPEKDTHRNAKAAASRSKRIREDSSYASLFALF